jgi:hypothetical protein
MTIDRHDAIDLAIDHLDAMGETYYIYRDDATCAWWWTTDDAMEQLGHALDRGDDDAYSAWCTTSTAKEVDLDLFAADLDEGTDLDALQNEAGNAGDTETYLVLCYLRDEVTFRIADNAEVAA